MGRSTLYVAGYSGFRIYEETLRIDFSEHFLGMRLNFFVSVVLCLIGLLWFTGVQREWHPLERVFPALRRARIRGEQRPSARADRASSGEAQSRGARRAIPAQDGTGH